MSRSPGLCAQEGGQYPIIGRGPMRKFKNNFLEFWDKLINKTQYTIIYDEAFLGNLVTIALVVSRFVYRTLAQYRQSMNTCR
jgi:hypothetical protein